MTDRGYGCAKGDGFRWRGKRDRCDRTEARSGNASPCRLGKPSARRGWAIAEPRRGAMCSVGPGVQPPPPNETGPCRAWRGQGEPQGSHRQVTDRRRAGKQSQGCW